MRSASRIVLRRCAMTMAVRPASRVARAASIRRLGAQVHRGGGLVEDQQPRVGDSARAKRHELALAGRQAGAALADHGVEALGERRDELGGADRVRRRRAAPRRSPPAGRTPGSRRRAGEEVPLLGDDRQLVAQRALRDVAQVVAVDAAPRPRRGRRSARSAWRASTCRRPWCRPARRSRRADVQVDVVQRPGRGRSRSPRRAAHRPADRRQAARVGRRRPAPARCRARRRSSPAPPSPTGTSL